MGLLDDFDLICDASSSRKALQDANGRQRSQSKVHRDRAKTETARHTTNTMTDVCNASSSSSSSHYAEAKETMSAVRRTKAVAKPAAPPPPPPQVERMSVAEMQAKVTKYGFRPSKQKDVLQQQVRDIFAALTPRSDSSEAAGATSGNAIAAVDTLADQSIELMDDLSCIMSSSPPSSALLLRRAPSCSQRSTRTHDSVMISSDDEEERREEMGDLSMALLEEERAAQREKEQRTKRATAEAQRQVGGSANSSRGSSSGAEEEEESDEFTDEERNDDDINDDDNTEASSMATGGGALGTVPEHVARQLHAAVLSDADLYRRILLFEPIPFDEFSSLANRANVQGLRSKETLRNWLDVQCICFFTAELRGPRTRY